MREERGGGREEGGREREERERGGRATEDMCCVYM